MQTPYFTNPTASAFGTGLLGMELLNKSSPYLQTGYNYLTGQSQFNPGSNMFVGPMQP
jgi:hypothetical protein